MNDYLLEDLTEAEFDALLQAQTNLDDQDLINFTPHVFTLEL